MGNDYTIRINSTTNSMYGDTSDAPFTITSKGPNTTTNSGIYRNSAFYLRNSNTAGIADLVFGYGIPGDTPLAGAWNGW